MEIWKIVPEYEKYRVSNRGRVRGVHGKILKERISQGYATILLYGENTRTYGVQVIVAMAFMNHNPCGHDIVIDHIDKNKLNNNLSNLQKKTTGANIAKGWKEKNITSKYRGVYWYKQSEKWRAQYSKKLLGTFETEEEANEAVKSHLLTIKNEIFCK